MQGNGRPWSIYPWPSEVEGFVALFADLLEKVSDRRYVKAKRHLHRFWKYLTKLKPLKPEWVIVEHCYISRDYLEDYAAYYARCYHPYPRECVRVHFSSQVELTNDAFRQLVVRDSGLPDDALERFADAYLGFIVLRPLPHTFIGTTCLKHYDGKNGQRHYAAHPCRVNLFGIPLEIDSVPFQEQDRAVSVCATAALWCVLQQTSNLWGHTVLSPAMVTEAASEVPRRSRALPSDGLTGEQMARVIQRVGLEPQFYKVETRNFLRGVAYAYLKCGIPLLLAQEQTRWEGRDPSKEDGDARHAVAVTGIRMKNHAALERFTSDRIDRLFGHDDQAVPFGRIDIEPRHPHDDANTSPRFRGDERSGGTHFQGYIATALGHPIYAKPEFVVVPLYNKIRIPFSSVKKVVIQLDDTLEMTVFKRTGRLVEWDLRLTDLRRFREFALEHCTNSDLRAELMTWSCPRYMWQATAMAGENTPLLDLLFDATDIGQQRLFLKIVNYDPLRALTITNSLCSEWFRKAIPTAGSLLFQISDAAKALSSGKGLKSGA